MATNRDPGSSSGGRHAAPAELGPAAAEPPPVPTPRAASRPSSGDIWGGLAAMLVAFPSAIAFGLLIYAPLGPAYAAAGAGAGILGTIAIGLVAPLFGGTPRLVSAPCAPAAAVMSALVVRLSAGHAGPDTGAIAPEQILMLTTLVTLLAGALQLVFGAIGGGRLIKYIPYPVVAGYLAGVGVLIFLGQVPKLLGLPKEIGLFSGLVSPVLWNTPGLVVGLTSMGTMAAASFVTRAVPAPILGLAAGCAAYFGLGAAYPGMLTLAGNPLVVGSLGDAAVLDPAKLLGRWGSVVDLSPSLLPLVVAPAITLAVLLSIDTLKTCVVIDALTRSRSDSNRELRGQGLGNLAAALLGGMPGAGTMGATLVNINSGGETRFSGALVGVFALVTFVLLGGLVAWVPIAGLAGILIVVAWRMVDPHIFHLLRQKSTIFDFVVVAAVVVTAVTANLIAAAGVGLALAILLFLREQIRGSVVRRKVLGNAVFSKKRRLPEESAVLERCGARTVICELQGSLFFGTTDQLFTELEPNLVAGRYVILDLRRVQSVDFTATHLLQQIEVTLNQRGGMLIFSSLPPNLPTGQDLQRYFDQVGLVKPARNVRVFDELDTALEWVEERILEEEGYVQATRDTPPLGLHEIHLFKGLDAETLAAIASCTEERSFGSGETIFSHGVTSDEILLIRSGSVRIVMPLAGGRQHHLASFGRGDFFGDMAFIDRAVRSAEAVAETPTRVYAISRARYDAVALQLPLLDRKVFLRLARALAIRLRQTDTELRALEEA